jgi:uncharacterized alkaline shock family protein YloU
MSESSKEATRGSIGTHFDKLISSISHVRWVIKGIKVYALVGKSGTGKSFRAKLLADKYGIDIIVDDGLLIYQNKILAGKTAKNERYSLLAVRVALFDEPAHRQAAIMALEHIKFRSILLLGTSDRMVQRISERLHLPSIYKIIQIEEVASAEEITLARKHRMEGKHVIPVPAIEIERDLGNIIHDTIRLFFRRKHWFKPDHEDQVEKTVVRPQFMDGSKGQLTIRPAALSQLILHCVQEFDNTLKPLRIKIRPSREGSYVVRLSLATPYKTQMGGVIHSLQRYIMENIEKYTGISLKEMHISVDKIIK